MVQNIENRCNCRTSGSTHWDGPGSFWFVCDGDTTPRNYLEWTWSSELFISSRQKLEDFFQLVILLHQNKKRRESGKKCKQNFTKSSGCTPDLTLAVRLHPRSPWIDSTWKKTRPWPGLGADWLGVRPCHCTEPKSVVTPRIVQGKTLGQYYKPRLDRIPSHMTVWLIGSPLEQGCSRIFFGNKNTWERDQKLDEGSTRLVYTGLCWGLEHLKIETRLRDERFESVKVECVI